MTIQDQAARLTEGALEMLFGAARHVPQEKLRWSSAETARSAISQLLECATAPLLHVPLLEGDPNPYAGAPMQAAQEQRGALEDASLDALHAAARERHIPLLATLRAFPDARLEALYPLPFGADFAMRGADLLFLPYWNLVYHTGQINYIQTLLGDRDLHF